MKRTEGFSNHLEYLEYLKKHKVAVVGLGIGNIELYKYLAANEVNVTGFDKSDDFECLKKDVLAFHNADFVFGNDYLDKLIGYDVIFKTQSMKRDLPQFLKAISNGATLTSEMWEFIKYCDSDRKSVV